MTKFTGKTLLGVSTIAMIVALPISSFAQTTDTVKKEETKKATAASETIVVTGSRLKKNPFNVSSPMNVITNENVKLAGTIDATKAIQSSTAAAGSNQINNFYTGFNVEGGGGIQTVGLNSLGSQRTLTLINGRRLPPSGTRGQVSSVDLQTLPNLAVDRYEILYEGASPIYGSDAVGGVVNAITRKGVNGFEVEASGQISKGGGGEDYNIGALWGKTADKWNILVSAEYFEQKALKYADRNYCQQDYVFDEDGAPGDFIDPATGQPKCFGLGVSYNRISAQGTAATGTGTWVVDPTSTTTVIGINPTTGAAGTKLKVPGYKRVFSPPAGVIGSPIANQLEYENDKMRQTDIISPSKRTNLYATGSRDFDVLGGIEVYGEGLYAKRESNQERIAQFFPTIPSTNIYNPIGANAVPVIIRPANNEQVVETWQVIAGVKGKTGSGLFGVLKNGDWDIYGQTSSGTGTYSGTAIRADRVAASLLTTVTGGVASCPTPLYGGSCLPINYFDPRVLAGNFTAAETAYLFEAENVGKTVYEQSIFEANVSGDLFKVPGASDDVKLNLGVHYREYSINDVPGIESRRGNTMFSTGAGITKGEDSVKEFYAEFAAPLIAKKPMIEDLTLTGAYRYTDYDSYDSNETWKATLDWRITPEISIIGNSGTSYRAPALYELFLGNQTGFLGQTAIDPCIDWGLSTNTTLQTRCNAAGIPSDYAGAMPGQSSQSATIITGGGAGVLKEEESKSDIVSVVYRPTGINLDLRFDFWRIEVTDAVDTFGAGSILGQCYAGVVGNPSYFCGLFTRDTNPASPRFNQILTVGDTYINVAAVEVQGVDLKARYRKEFTFGDLIVDSQHRWTTSYKQGLTVDDELFEYAGTVGAPVYNSQTQLRFERQDWTYAWTINAIGKTSNSRLYLSDTASAPPGTYYAYNGLTTVNYKRDAETTITHDFSVRYRSDNWTVIGAVSNLFNEDAPSISTSSHFGRLGNIPLASQYDVIGTTATVSVTRRF